MNRESCTSTKRNGRLGSKRAAVYAAALAAGIMTAAFPSAALDIEQVWSNHPDMIMEGAAMVVDLDGDGDDEILTAAYENMIVVDGTGEELWRFDTAGRYSTCPAILEREGASPLIYAGDNKGQFTCLDGAGDIVWQVEGIGVFCASPALADLDGDGVVEVVQGTNSGAVHVFDALTGTPVWTTTVEVTPGEGGCSSPAIGDLDGDGALEIVIATGAGKVFALNASGEVLWESSVGGTSPDWATCSPILFGNSKGEVCVAAASRLERFYCLDSQGNVLWERPTRGAVASTISAGDFDNDGRADLFAVTQLGVLYRFDEDGRVLWDIDTQGRSLASGAIIDLDGDGVLEYLLCTQRGTLLAFDNAGKIVFTHQFDTRTINVTPAFGDIVKERPGLEFAITGGESARIFCMGTPAPLDAAADWETYRGDKRLTGAWFGLISAENVGMSPVDLAWDNVLTTSDVAFRVVNPEPGDAPLVAEASCVRPDGSRQVAVGKVVGRRGTLNLPVSITAPGVYQFEWALKDAANTVLAAGSRELTFQPYQNDQALAQRAVLALEQAIGDAAAPDAKRGLKAAMRQESLGIADEAQALVSLQAAAPGSALAFLEELNARTAALNARAQRALALAHAAPSLLASAPNSSVVAFEGITWENRDVDKQLPTEAAIPLQIARRSVPGEHEPVSVKLLNVTLDSVEIGARIATSPGGPAVTAFEVKPVPTNQNTTAWDPIVPLADGKMAIPSLETREVWLDIDTANVKPGTYQVDVSLNGGSSETKVEIALEVLPFEMAGFGAMRLCCWASYNEDAVKDLLAHGNNVFTAGLPPVTVVEGDPVQLELDFAALDEFVSWLGGYDAYLLMNGMPALGVAMESEAYVTRFAEYLDQLMTHLAAKGVREDRVALYPHDEPGGHGWDTVHHYIAFARQGLKARPNLKFYVNGGGDLAMFEAMNEIAAIWCPGFYMLAEDTPTMRFLKGSGKELWSYDCGYSYARPIGANVKTINVVAQYRLAAIHGFNFGGDGIGYWCYNVGPSMWDAIRDEYPLVYVNEDETQTASRRWEAVREGMEDARILIALRDKLADPAVSNAAKARIRHLLDETVAGQARQALDEVTLGVARYVIDASNNDATVEEMRKEMMDCVALLAE